MAATHATDDVCSPSIPPVAPAPFSVTHLRASERDVWLDHVAASFAAKGTPRAYFARHLDHDPHLDYASIIVLHVPDALCVSSIRVFLRAVYVDGRPAMVGGIGEVSTRPAWRGRGYAELCLKEGLAYLGRLGVRLSSLHTSNAAAYYHKLGWRTVERAHAVLRYSSVAQPSSLSTTPALSASSPSPSLSLPAAPPPRVRPFSPADIGSAAAFAVVQSMYASFAAAFNGPVHRSSEYWLQWVRGEWSHSLSTASPIIGCTYHSDDSAQPTAYLMVARTRWELRLSAEGCADVVAAEHLTVREFACAEPMRLADGGRSAFDALLRYAAEAAGFSEEERETLLVRVPLPVIAQFRPPMAVPYIREDSGFMYRAVDDSLADGVTAASSEARYSRQDFAHVALAAGDELVQQLQRGARHRHVFFDTDAF